MTSTYANTYVIPAAGSQWNGISSQVSLTRVTSGNYIVNAQVATGTDQAENKTENSDFKLIRKDVIERFKEIIID